MMGKKYKMKKTRFGKETMKVVNSVGSAVKRIGDLKKKKSKVKV